MLRRDDGSFLALGGLSIFAPAGERGGLTAPFLAAAAFTPTLTLDGSFGGRPPAARPTVQVRRQRARTAAARGSISLRVAAPEAGLVFLRVRDGRGRILGSATHPVYAAGPKIMSVPLTSVGRRVLRRARRGLRIVVGHQYRDVVAVPGSGVTRGRLR